MNEPAASLFSLLLSDPVSPESRLIAEALAKFLNVPFLDAMHKAKHAWGVLSEGMDETAAQELKTFFAGSGVSCLVVPDSTLVSLPPAQMITKGEFSSEGIRVPMKPGEVALFRWDRLRVIGAAGFNETTTRTVQKESGPSMGQKALSLGILMSTGIPLSVGGKKKKVEKIEQREEQVFFLDLLYDHPPFRLRIDARYFDYSFLKERKAYNAFGNFRILVEDVVRLAPPAFQSRGARVLSQGKPASGMGYESLDDLERECRWLAALKRV